jgi:hypothetical protein
LYFYCVHAEAQNKAPKIKHITEENKETTKPKEALTPSECTLFDLFVPQLSSLTIVRLFQL